MARGSETLAAKGVTMSPLRPANCGFTVAWSEIFRDRFEGQPLKGVALSFGAHTVRGEAMITRTGIEGGAIYALSAELREAHRKRGQATLHIALRPDLDADELDRAAVGAARQAVACRTSCARPRICRPSPSACCRRRPIASGTPLRRCRRQARRLDQRRAGRLTGTAPIARAISTAGGIAFDELDADFMLRRLPGVFVAGEMLDWEAPTGGYLLQACFATGAAAGSGALQWLATK